MSQKKSTTTKFFCLKLNILFGKNRMSLITMGFLLLLGAIATAQPSISGLALTASSPGNLTNDNLICTYTTGPTVVETASSWWVDGMHINSLYMPFEAGPTNALLDFSGRHNDAYTSGYPDQVPAWDATGGYNGSGAFDFDGDDFLIVDNAISINSDYTKTAWIYMTGDDFRNIISSSYNGTADHHFKVDPDSILNAGHSFGAAIVEDQVKLVEDTWYFVAVSFDYESGEMILYKDGVEVDWGIVPENIRSITGTTVQIGARDEQWGWKGKMDEPRIWDRVLSPEQIMSLYTNGNNLLLAQETVGADGWTVDVTPFSTSAVGETTWPDVINIQGPVISGLSLSATSPDDMTTDDLEVDYAEGPAVVETATTWYKNGTPESLLYLPFEGGPHNALRDFSGNDHPAANPLVRDWQPTWDASGGHNGTGAFIFDGNDYLHAGAIFPLNSSYTKSAWINMSGSGYRNIMSSINHEDNNHTFKVDPDGTLNAGHSMGTAIVRDPSALSNSQWYFVAVSFDYESGEMILYRNGGEVHRATVPEALRSVAEDSVLIGSLNWDYDWEGSIDDLRLYDRALSPEQISALYVTGNTVMVSEETSGADEWYVEVRPISMTDVGSTYTSNTITVHSVLVSEIPDQTIAEGGTFTPVDLDDYVLDEEYANSELDWSASGNSEITVVIDPVTHLASFTMADINWYGSEDITFTATNPGTDSDAVTVTFTVTNVNDAPVLTVIGGQNTPEDNTKTGLTVTFSDPDPDDEHTIEVESSNPSVSIANLSGNISGSTYDLVPDENWNGNCLITVTVTDNASIPLSHSEIYTFRVDPVNDAPVLSEIGDQDTNEDNTLAGRAVNFTDPEGSDSHTIAVFSDEPNVSIANLSGHISGSTYDLVPAADWNGTAQITVSVTDDGTVALSDVEIYTLTVGAVNDAPVISPIGDQVTVEDVALNGRSVDFTDPDEADSHTISVVSLEPNVAVQNLSGHISGSTYNLVPAANWVGTAQITVTVTENAPGGLSDTEIYALTVGAINDAPELTEIGDQSIDEDNSVLGLAVDFSDLDLTDDHTITVVSSETGVSIANLIGNTSGSTYDLVPDPDWNGSTEITVTVTDDGTGPLSDSETYTFTVNPINDAPAYIGLSNNAVDEGVAIGTVVGLLSSTDPDISDTHTYEFVFEGGDEEIDNLFFTIDLDTVKVLAELDYEQQNTFSLLVKSDDGNGGTLTQQVPVIVNNVVETFIDENESLSFKVYPVPAVDYLTVEVDNPENAELLLEIYSNAGVLVHSEHTVHGNIIDLNKFSKGMYILRIRGERVFETCKIIVGD